MSFDSPIEKKQGAFKASEMFTDETLQIIKNSVGESGINTLRLLMNPIGDAIRMNNFILHSTGQINWNGADIEFDSDAQANNIVLRLLMIDENTPSGSPAPRTIDLYLNGSTTANSEDEFLTLSLNDQELLYIELDRDILLNAVSPSPGNVPARINVKNNVSSISLATGARLQKVSLSDTSGMPAMLSTESGATKSNTVNIPLAARFDWTDGIDTFSDIWWIPHGIRWPQDVRSVLGAVVVRGLETLPSVFVRTALELQQAVSDLSNIGGIILLSESITLDQNITIPAGVTLCGRSDLTNGLIQAGAKINMNVGGRLTLIDDARLWNLFIEGQANFGQTIEETMVLISGNHSKIDECSFRLTNPGSGTGQAVCVTVSGTNNRLWHNKFRLATATTDHVGVKYIAGFNNIDNDSFFEVS